MNAARNMIGIVVSTDAPPAPYPADTRAKGWRFEIDYERIEQSDTWVLATPDMRPWLLMLWMTAWRQTPCGSMPAQDELIAARIGMDLRQFRGHRDILMRGWWLAADGRMYHHTITEQVLGLLEMRDREAARKQAYRDKKNQRFTGKCPAGQARDSHGIPASATPPEPEPVPEPIPVKEAVESNSTAAGAHSDDAPRKRSAEAKKPRAARLPQDWTLPKSWGDWAVSELGMQPAAVRTEAAKFADHWHAKAGRDAAKLDWLATWRNWCRTALERSPRPLPGRQQPAPAQTDAQRTAEVRRLLGFDAIDGDVIEGGGHAR